MVKDIIISTIICTAFYAFTGVRPTATQCVITYFIINYIREMAED